MTPLLSICIPTYNRAHWLELALFSLAPQVRDMDGTVELIVSDNCSTDGTEDIVRRAQQYGPVRYHKNSTNIGAARNILVLVEELARGDYCWILGDDDMVVNGKLAKLTDTIGSHRNLDYFYVNYFSAFMEQRNRIIVEEDSSYTPELNECMCHDLSERYVSDWLQLLSVDTPRPAELFTAVVCHVFRRSMWTSHAHLLQLDNVRGDRLIVSFDADFPHIKILAHAMAGKPAYYIGDPCVLLGVGSQEWWKYLSTVMLIRLNEALDLYANLGADPLLVQHHRKHLLSYSGPYVRKMLVKPNSFRDYLLLMTFFRRYWTYRILWASICEPFIASAKRRVIEWRVGVRTSVPRSVFVPIRGVWRATRALTRALEWARSSWTS